MSTELEVVSQDLNIPGFGNKSGFELMQRICTALMSASMVPAAYQNNMGNCLIAFNMSLRMNIDPITVMQNLYIVHGTPGWSSKFLIGTFNQCGKFSTIQYEFFGEPETDEWGCRAYASEKSSGEKHFGPKITIALSKKNGWYEKSGSKWKTMPEQMLRYRSAAWFINTVAPELSLGMPTADEVQDSEGYYDGKTGEFNKLNIKKQEINDEVQSLIDSVENCSNIDEVNKLFFNGTEKLYSLNLDSKAFREAIFRKKEELRVNSSKELTSVIVIGDDKK